MRQFTRCLLLLAGTLSTVATPTFAEEARIVVASLQPFEECRHLTYSPELRSGCYVVPKAQEKFPGIVGWKLPPKSVQDRVFPKTQAMLSVRPVYKKQARRLIAAKHCRNCKFVSAQSTQGKQLARQYARHFGVQLSSIVGFFIPFPFSIVANTVACAAVSTGFDAKEYHEDYNMEPTSEQYSSSFSSNLLYCSPIGGFMSAQNPLQFMLAGLGFASYFVALPTAVGYLQQGAPLIQYVTNSYGKKVAVQKPSVRVARQSRSPRKLVAAVQPQQ
jgi:hypothetical protein